MPALPADAAPVAVRMLGSFEVRGRGTVLDSRSLGGGRPRQLLELLLLGAGSTVTKARLAERLWPDRRPADMLPTLESYVSVLRHHLVPAVGSRTGLVRTCVGGYVVDRTSVTIDVDQLGPLVRLAEGAPADRAARLLEQVLDMTTAPFLADEGDSEWVQEARRDHALVRTDVLVAAARVGLASGHADLALRLADRALAGDPHSEPAWAVRISALDGVGLQGDALRAYATCRELFATELGCAPGAVVQEAFDRALANVGRADDDLGHLVSALIRVHAVAEGHRATGPVPGRSTGSGSAEEACRALLDLVRRARPATSRLGLAR